MKLAIIGKPQCGKTTVFNAAAGQQEAVGDYSQALHRAVIKVPDKRVDRLAELVQPDKHTYAEIEFLDAPGFTGKGKESTGLKVTNELREMDALIMVIDAFSPEANPERFIGNLTDEMMLADLVVVENNIENKSRKLKLTGDKTLQMEIDLLQKCRASLEAEQPLLHLELEANEEKRMRNYQFLSKKPLLIMLNIAEDDLPNQDAIYQKYAHLIQPGKRELATLCGKIQMELATLSPEEQQAFFEDLGVTASAMDKVIQKSYALLGLISFLTTGKPDVRAWTIKYGTTAHKAAGVIHSDMERGFIRAEVTPYEDYIRYETIPALKAAGKTRLEGKDYIVQDGDVILFRFNV
ncbi:MAG: YchF family ATPase [candidate division Zixibacteria bacterium]|nr:YchF family ATPase [candidate division Zixibacteria bacterium]